MKYFIILLIVLVSLPDISAEQYSILPINPLEPITVTLDQNIQNQVKTNITIKIKDYSPKVPIRQVQSNTSIGVLKLGNRSSYSVQIKQKSSFTNNLTLVKSDIKIVDNNIQIEQSKKNYPASKPVPSKLTQSVNPDSHKPLAEPARNLSLRLEEVNPPVQETKLMRQIRRIQSFIMKLFGK